MQKKIEILIAEYAKQGLDLKPPQIARMALAKLFEGKLGYNFPGSQ